MCNLFTSGAADSRCTACYKNKLFQKRFAGQAPGLGTYKNLQVGFIFFEDLG